MRLLFPDPWHRPPLAACLCGLALLLAACASPQKTGDEGGNGEEKEPAAAEKSTETESGELDFLLSMRWEEARAISSNHMELPPHYRLTADEIEVLKTDPQGAPQRVRARGKIFIEMLLDEPARVLAQEAFVSEDEVILRGKPLLRRGDSVIEGLHDATVFYFLGSRLKVLGRHRLHHQPAVAVTEASAAVAPAARGGFGDPGPPPALPILQGPWAGGPNPLLPPLSPDTVPAAVRQKMLEEAQAVEVTPLFLPAAGGAAEPPAFELTGPPAPGEEPEKRNGASKP